MTITPPPRLAFPDENHSNGAPSPLPPPEYAPVLAKLPKLGWAATRDLSHVTEASGHERAKLLHQRERLQADRRKADDVRADRMAVNARADAADRAITGAPHGNRRRRIPTVLYAALMTVLFALNIPLDMTGLFGLQMSLGYTLLLAAISGIFILGSGHFIGHYLKRRSHCVAPDLQLPASERRLALSLGISVTVGILILAALRGITTGLLGALFVLAVLGGEFALSILLAYHHQHDGERDRRHADRQVDRRARAHRVSIREEQRQLQRFLGSRTRVAAAAASWTAKYDLLESVAANNWRISHPDQTEPPRLQTPAWVDYARALAAGAIPTQLLLPEEGAARPPETSEDPR